MKRIRYSAHAIQRMVLRDISESEVVAVVKSPDYVKTSIDGRKIAVKKIGIRTFNVVYIEQESYIKIITIYYR